MILCCNFCNNHLKHYRIWYLENIKGFEQRELFIEKCPNCRRITVVLKEVGILDKKIFFNKIKSETDALKTMARENKRIIKEVITSDINFLKGWIYGSNKEIRTKNGKISQIRQYATDFSNKKQLVKKIMV